MWAERRGCNRDPAPFCPSSTRDTVAMANTAHLVRRQSSRDLKPQKSVDKLEMKEMRGRLVVEGRKSNITASYGATNAGFDDSSPSTKVFFTLFFILR